MARTRYGTTSILGGQNGREIPLTFAMALIAMVACLAAAAAIAAWRYTRAFEAELAGAATVRVLAPETPQGAQAAIAVLRAQPGIIRADLIGEDRARTLLAPWLAGLPLAADVPLPLMIDVRANGLSAQLGPTWQAELAKAGISAKVHVHAPLAQDAMAAAQSARLIAFAIVLILGLASAAMVSFATHAGLATQKESVELLHQLGATRAWIKGLFARRYFRVGFLAGALGALTAGAVLAGLYWAASTGRAPALIEDLLAPIDAVWLIACPLASGFVAHMTAARAAERTVRKLA